MKTFCVWFLLLILSMSALCVNAAPARDTATVGYLDSFGGWYLSSLFPLFRSAFDKAGVAVDLVDIKETKTEAELWEKIRHFEVLVLSDWDLADKHRKIFDKYQAAGGGMLVITPYSGLKDRQDLIATIPDVLKWLGITPMAQGVHDPKTAFGAYSWTRQITQHPITAGVECIAYPKVGDKTTSATSPRVPALISLK